MNLVLHWPRLLQGFPPAQSTREQSLPFQPALHKQAPLTHLEEISSVTPGWQDLPWNVLLLQLLGQPHSPG